MQAPPTSPGLYPELAAPSPANTLPVRRSSLSALVFLSLAAESCLANRIPAGRGEPHRSPTARRADLRPFRDQQTDATLITTLPLDTYTVQVSGVGGVMGVALFEVFVLLSDTAGKRSLEPG